MEIMFKNILLKKELNVPSGSYLYVIKYSTKIKLKQLNVLKVFV